MSIIRLRFSMVCARFLLRAAKRGCWLSDGQPKIGDLEDALFRLLDGGEVTPLLDRATATVLIEGVAGTNAMKFFRPRDPLKGARCLGTLSCLLENSVQLPVWSGELYAEAGKAGKAAEMRALTEQRRAAAQADRGSAVTTGNGMLPARSPASPTGGVRPMPPTPARAGQGL